MVKIIGVKVSENKDGIEFISLKLQGGAEAVQSLQTGKFYLTARSCYISCTFTQSVAEGFIGSELPGKVVRVNSDPYEYIIKETGEKINLSHRYEFIPETKAERRVRENAAI